MKQQRIYIDTSIVGVFFDKNFDCLKMKEEIQAKVYERTKDMTFPELDSYLNESLKNDSLWQRLAHRDYNITKCQ